MVLKLLWRMAGSLVPIVMIVAGPAPAGKRLGRMAAMSIS